MPRYLYLLAAPAVALILLGPIRPASAGRTHYGWLYGTEVNPEHGVEVETWIREENNKGDLDEQETLLWWAPVVGLTEHLELAVPFEARYEASDEKDAAVHFVRWGAEVRYRFDSPDPILAGRVTTLARIGAKRLIEERTGVRGEADLVVAFEEGRFHSEIDVGVVTAKAGDAEEVEIVPGAGVSIELVSGLRLGAEAYAELALVGDGVDWLALGPNLGLTKGRFWLSATLAIGVFGIDTAPRVNFGIAF